MITPTKKVNLNKSEVLDSTLDGGDAFRTHDKTPMPTISAAADPT